MVVVSLAARDGISRRGERILIPGAETESDNWEALPDPLLVTRTGMSSTCPDGREGVEVLNWSWGVPSTKTLKVKFSGRIVDPPDVGRYAHRFREKLYDPSEREGERKMPPKVIWNTELVETPVESVAKV